MFAAKFCKLIMRNYTEFSLEISYVPVNLKNPEMFTPFATWDKTSKNIT